VCFGELLYVFLAYLKVMIGHSFCGHFGEKSSDKINAISVGDFIVPFKVILVVDFFVFYRTSTRKFPHVRFWEDAMHVPVFHTGVISKTFPILSHIFNYIILSIILKELSLLCLSDI